MGGTSDVGGLLWPIPGLVDFFFAARGGLLWPIPGLTAVFLVACFRPVRFLLGGMATSTAEIDWDRGKLLLAVGVIFISIEDRAYRRDEAGLNRFDVFGEMPTGHGSLGWLPAGARDAKKITHEPACVTELPIRIGRREVWPLRRPQGLSEGNDWLFACGDRASFDFRPVIVKLRLSPCSFLNCATARLKFALN